ncbi:MAG: hypothetical protein RI885_2288 [Actinomycetota bacterium]|jgi:transcriptional regulator with XRE-family HTH domain
MVERTSWGRRLSEIRVSLGYANPRDAALATGFSPAYIRMLENEATPLTGNAIMKLADGYGLGVDELREMLGVAPRAARTRPSSGAGTRRAAANGT